MKDPEYRPLVAIADDNEYLVELTHARFLANRWRTLRLTESSQVAPALLAAPVDLLVLDIEMPGESGLEVLRKLREEPRTADIAVIMLTGRRSTADVKAALALGALEYVLKPFELETLVKRVERCLALRLGTPMSPPATPCQEAFEI